MEKIDINVLLNKFKSMLYKSFVDLIFHDLLWKNTNSWTISNGIFNLFKKGSLSEINKNNFKKINKIDLQTTSISFSALLKLFSTDKKTYINTLWLKF